MLARLLALGFVTAGIFGLIMLDASDSRAHATETAQNTSTGSVPSEASALAEQMLRQMWLPSAAKNPKQFGVLGMDISTVRLGSPYREFDLRGRGIDEYIASSDDDPTAFPGVWSFCFPIECEDSVVGAIIVAWNLNENGRKFIEKAGAFMRVGWYTQPNPTLSSVIALRSRFGNSTDVIVTSFQDTGVAKRYMVRSGSTVKCGPEISDLRSVDSEGEHIRAELKSERTRRAAAEALHENTK